MNASTRYSLANAISRLDKEFVVHDLRCSCSAVRTVSGDRVVSVRDADDLGEQRNLIPAKPVGITKPVQPFMMVPHDLPHEPERPQLAA